MNSFLINKSLTQLYLYVKLYEETVINGLILV